MTNSLRLVCLTLTLVLAPCNGDDGGEPASPPVDTVATIKDEPWVYNDNVFVLPVAESLATDRLPFRKYTARFYDYFDDDFDFLMFVSNLEGGDQHGYLGIYHTVMNDTAGIGLETYSNTADWGSAAKLQGVMHFPI